MAGGMTQLTIELLEAAGVKFNLTKTTDFKGITRQAWFWLAPDRPGWYGPFPTKVEAAVHCANLVDEENT